MDHKIAVIKGDGIGPEIVDAALDVLEAIGREFKHRFKFEYLLAGGAALEKEGSPLPKKTIRACKSCDAVLIGAFGDPKWDDQPVEKRPERAITGLREEFALFAGLYPAIIWKQLTGASPLKQNIIAGGLDILIVRELSGGIYYGPRGTEMISSKTSSSKIFDKMKGGKTIPEGRFAYDVEQYSEMEIRRIAKLAFDMAMKRDKRLTSVEKSDILDTSRLWRTVIEEVHTEYPEIALDHLYVEQAARMMINNPHHFDVIITGNMFGDILSGEASQMTGSAEMLPAASLGKGSFGLFGSSHGSTTEHTGNNTANPIAAILSAAMMLKYSLSLDDEAAAIEEAIGEFFSNNNRTPDIMITGANSVGTSETGKLIAGLINKV